MQHARGALKKIFREIVRREGSDAAIMAWPLACGPRTAARTSAVSFADGVLTVAVPDEGWSRQLQNFVPQYLAALNQLSAEPVRSIDFQVAHGAR
jgi:hypothetical protein